MKTDPPRERPGEVARRAVFMDRDGTLNVEKHYLHRPEDWEWLPGVPEGLARLAAGGYRLVVVSNQSGIARGYYAAEAVERLHEFVNRALSARGARIERFLFCPHGPDEEPPCECRKPSPGMMLRAAREMGLDLAASWMVGDKRVDVEAGLAAGCRVVGVRTGYGRKELATPPDGVTVVDDFPAAAQHVLACDGGA